MGAKMIRLGISCAKWSPACGWGRPAVSFSILPSPDAELRAAIFKTLQREDLEAALSHPVRIANDANCFALSEATDGAAKGKNIVFGIIAGTGVGGAVGSVGCGSLPILGINGHPNVPHDCRYIKASTDWTQTESGIAGDTRSTSNIAKGW